MEQFFDYSAFHDPTEDSGEASAQQLENLAHAMNAPLQDQSRSSIYHPTGQPPMSCEVKPRLTKEQHDILEAHFQKQHKPTTNVKRGFADALNVSLDKVNVSCDLATPMLTAADCRRTGFRTGARNPSRMRRRPRVRLRCTRPTHRLLAPTQNRLRIKHRNSSLP